MAELSLGFSAVLFISFSFRVPHRGFTVALQALASHHIASQAHGLSRRFLLGKMVLIFVERTGPCLIDGDALRPHRSEVASQL